MAGKCLFNQNWLENRNYKDWLQCHSTDRHQAKCLLCFKTFSIAKMGESALKSHMKGAKHTQLLSIKMSSNISSLLKPTTSKAVMMGEKKIDAVVTQTAGIGIHVAKNDVMDAEIIWTMKTIKSHNSYRSNDDIEKVFRQMFPDSAIASKFSCGAKKTSYYAVFGIAPFVKDLLLQDLVQKQNYVLLFDESLNEMRQKKQMDVHVRFWSNDTVITRFFTSVFMGHATAENLFESFKTAILPLKLSKVLQLSMDGPNVNWKFFSMLQDETAKEFNKQLLNIGSCGLHIIHNAFQCGCQSTNWEISSFLQSLYFLFKDSPARREDFLKLVNHVNFPKKFVKHRWLENILATECALELLPDVLRYINAIKKKSLPTPQCKSFSVVQHSVEDNLLEVKLHIFLSVAKVLYPFLLKYQTDKPMIFFLSDDFKQLLISLLQRFIQPHIMKEANILFKLIKLDFKDPKLHCKLENIDIGFIAEKKLRTLLAVKKVSSCDVFNIRMECKHFLVTVVAKLTEKSPVTYSLVRHLSCFDPRHMANNKHSCVKKLRLVLNYLTETNQLQESECDDVIRQFSIFLDTEVATEHSLFSDFDPENSRVDTFLCARMNIKKYSNLWKVVGQMLLLSHGQATVERGFSVNKKIEIENMKEHTYIAHRLICEYINLSGGDVHSIKITKELRSSVANARQKYLTYLEDQKMASLVRGQKRAVDSGKAHELKKKKICLERDIQELLKSADSYAEQAEDTSDVTLIAKSNSLRRSAKDKQQQLFEIERTLKGWSS